VQRKAPPGPTLEPVVETVAFPAAETPEPTPVEPAPQPVEPHTEADLALPLAIPEPSAPETEFVARVLPAEPERPFPAARRAIFFDVENTSRAEHIARVIDHLAVDRLGKRTEFVAVGNWKVIGPDTARLLSHHGAQLVHSAPAAGVRDWSDLRIAVSAGVWLASARPGDIIEIVSNDRAFDAVGDVAAGLGIAFRRLAYQGLSGLSSPVSEPSPLEFEGDGRSRRRRRGRRRGRSGMAGPAYGQQAPYQGRPPLEPRRGPEHVRPADHRRPEPAPRESPRPEPAPRESARPEPASREPARAEHPPREPARPEHPRPAPERPEPARAVDHHREHRRPVDHLPAGALPTAAASGNGAEAESPHTAPHDEIVALIRDLIHHTPSRRVSIDSLANTLKARGFRRTPGSPRLITRLRRIKEVDVSPTGIITLSPEYEAHDAEPVPGQPVREERPVIAVELEPEPVAAEEADEEERQPDVTPAGEPIAATAAAPSGRRRGGRGRRGGGASSRKPRRAAAKT
jgi:hypothetical protein